ncbi:iron complex transport system ATP-binding protein [Prevotellaceae bacterium MN60]|nr:iron complex transport system ATP-binding protein [Prevotellaceae bacterium MN60]
MMENVTLQDLGIGYLSKDSTKWVAQHLNGVIHGGELTCLLGRNGIGKSTLLRTLSAFQPALEGEVLMGDTPLTACSDKELSQRIGVVLTEKPDVRNMTVAEMVGMGRSPYTGFWGTLSENDRQIVDEALLLVGIGELRGRMIHTLSDGERQKVMIAKALAQQTSVIYLDEPTAFLDFPSKVEMLQLLRNLAHEEQKTIFLSTHDVELSLQLADTIWLMEPNCLHVGTPQQLALEGVLGTFIERESVTFDPQTLTIHVAR